MRVISLALAAAVIFMSCSSTKSRTQSGSPHDFPVIDAHTHTAFSGEKQEYSGIVYSKEAMIEEMKSSGVVGAVSHTNDDEKGYHDLRAHNIIHCFGIKEKVNLEKLKAGLASKKYNCIKIYLGYSYYYPYDRRYQPVYQLAAKHKVPVVFHTGDTYTSMGKLKYADPLTIDEVAVDHRDVNFVIAHAGNPWIQSAAEVAYKNPNVYIEGSALLIGDFSSMPQDKIDEFVVKPLKYVFGYLENPSKMMFGTDWPLTHMSTYIEAYKKAIPREHWRAVFYENAQKVFKFTDQ